MLEQNRCTMEQATAVLTRQQIRFVKKTGFQIKVGQFNFYPNKGTIYIDGQPKALEEKGLDSFIKLLRRGRLAPEKPNIQTVNYHPTLLPQKPPEDDEFALEL